MPDAVLTRDGPVSVPLDYVVPQSGELAPLTIRAVLDGTSATSAFYAIVEVLAPTGRSMGKYRSDAIAAGASADVTWFPGAELEEEGGETIAGVTLEQLFLDSTSTGVTSSTVLQSGVAYLLTVQGTYSFWNANLDVGTPNADAMFPGSLAGRVSTEVGVDAETCFALLSTNPGQGIGHNTKFEVNLGSGYSHVEPQGGPFVTPQANYLYRYPVTGQGSTVSFRVNDTPLNDNYGKLQMTIQGFSGQSSGGGGAGSLVPPDGTNNALLRAVSGVPTWSGPPTIAAADIVNTGVAAGSYGDNTHVAQVQVNAQGQVTNVSSVAISGSAGAGGLILLYDSTAGGSVTSFDTGANGVASGHAHLIIYLLLRSDGAVTIDTCQLRFNGDSGANYDYLWLRNAAGTLSSVSGFAQTAASVGQSVGNSGTAGEAGPFKIDIPSYDQTTFRKGAIAHSGPTVDTLANSQTTHSSFSWRSTAAINQIAVFPQTGTHWLAGSRMTIYGAQ